MAIPFECTGCGKKLKVKDEAAGKRIKCPECQAVLTVPKPESAGDEDDFLGGLDEAVKQEKKRPRAVIDDDEDYGDAPPTASPKRRAKKTASRKSSGSSSAGGVLKTIGGVVIGLLVVLGIVGKVAKVGGLGGFGQSVSWQKFQHPKGGASIDMPGVATLDVRQSTDPDAPVYSATARQFGCSFTAAALPPLAGMAANDRATAQLVFNEIKRAYMASKPGARLISESPVQLGTAIGVEMRFEVSGVINVSRTYLTPTHLVVAEMVFQKSSEPAADRDRYFNSIQLTGVPAGGAAPMPGMNPMPGMPGMMPPGAAHQPNLGTPAVP